MTKVCTRCGVEKELGEFEIDVRKRDVTTGRCKACAYVYKMKWASDHHTERLEKQRAFREANPELVKQRKKEEYQKHKDAYNACSRKNYRLHKEECAVYAKEYRKARQIADPSTRLPDRLRHRINQALKGKTKSAPTIVLLGCTVEELKQYLESLFTEGMSWDNWGYDG